MNVVVTGATGFVGRHVVEALLARGHAVTAVARNAPPPDASPWRGCRAFVACDLHADDPDPASHLGVPDALLHLAWPGLPNYREAFHFEVNLPASYRFIRRMVASGTPQVLVAGTCFEYGMQNGALPEDAPALPDTAYGVAKHSLMLFLEGLRRQVPFVLQWARLFYLHGPGQPAGSLLAQLDRAIDDGAPRFDMSGGEQLRDYLPVDEAARHFVHLIEQPQFAGVTNVCSGQPVSVRSMVEARIRERGASIALNLGHFPYRDTEPFAFWGVRDRLDQVLGKRA